MQTIKKIFFLLILFAAPLWSIAQCSVCSAVVQSSMRNGSGIAKGLNTGILYLLAFPYFIFMGFIIYRYREFITYKFRSLVQKWTAH